MHGKYVLMMIGVERLVSLITNPSTECSRLSASIPGVVSFTSRSNVISKLEILSVAFISAAKS